MNVVVTGGSGLTGRFVVQDLVEHGHKVLSLDQTALDTKAAPYKLIDMQDLGQVYGALRGADAVVHLAAIPRPVFHTGDVTFRNNVMATYNVFEAALTFEIPRVVAASSMAVLGYPFFSVPVPPQYVPIDEAHPRLAQDPYALSKVVGEEIAEAFVRRSGGKLTAISLRLTWIHTPETFAAQIPPYWNDLPSAAASLWGYVDARDVALACRLALEAKVQGHETAYISAADTFMKMPTADLVRMAFPDAIIRPTLTGRSTVFDLGKAATLLGYDPQYSWEQYNLIKRA